MQRYQQTFLEAVQHSYPLSSYVLSELEDLREILGLRKEDIDSIEQEVIAQVAQKPEVGQEACHQKLQQYEQQFRLAIEAEYPLSDHIRSGLNDFQQFLGLKGEDAEQIERPLVSQKEAEHRQKREAEQLRQKQEQEKLKLEQERLESRQRQSSPKSGQTRSNFGGGKRNQGNSACVIFAGLFGALTGYCLNELLVTGGLYFYYLSATGLVFAVIGAIIAVSIWRSFNRKNR